MVYTDKFERWVDRPIYFDRSESLDIIRGERCWFERTLFLTSQRKKFWDFPELTQQFSQSLTSDKIFKEKLFPEHSWVTSYRSR